MSQQRARGRGGPAGGAGGRGRGGPPSRGGGYGGGAPLIYNAGQRPQPDLSLVSPNEVIVRMRNSNPGPERPARPGYGTAGRAVALRANFFALESMPDMIYEYIVQITPEPKSQKPRMKRRVLALFEQTSELRPYINDIAHDGAQRLISSKPLPDEITGPVLFYEEGDPRPPRDADEYNVAITFFKELSTEPLKL
jgi:eukaryotic translation initiation factor 2C